MFDWLTEFVFGNWWTYGIVFGSSLWKSLVLAFGVAIVFAGLLEVYRRIQARPAATSSTSGSRTSQPRSTGSSRCSHSLHEPG